MPKNKDRDKSKQARRAEEWANKRKGVNWDVVWKVLSGVFAFAGSMVAGYELVNYFRSDAKTFYSIIFPGLGITVWTVILVQLIRKKNPYAIPLLVVTFLGGVVGVVGWQSYNQTQENKVIVLVAQFDGPEETYGLHDQIMEDLRQATKNYNDTEIIDGKEVVTAGQGREYAQELGKKAKADLVIWAWYRPTENPNIIFHLENLSSNEFDIVKESEAYRPETTLAGLESFEIQHQLGAETTNLVSFLIGYSRFNNGDDKTASQLFEQVINNPSAILSVNRIYLFLLLGYAHVNLHQYENSIEDFNQAIQIDSSFALAYNGRGTAYSYLGRLLDAKSDFDQAIVLNPSSVLDYSNRGLVYFSLRQFDQAKKDLDYSLQLDPNNVRALNNRGGIYNEIGNYDQAIKDFEKIIQIDPTFAAAYNGLGFAYDNLGQHETAISKYNQAIRIAPAFAIAYENRGIAYRNLGKYDLALGDYNQAIKIVPSFAEAYNARGFTYANLGQFDRALIDYNYSIKLKPNYASAYNNRGTAYGELGQYDQAVRDLSQAIQLDPYYAQAYHNRGFIYQKLGKAAEATADFKKYEELTGKKP
jgi:tetratricopeptide (TPR) repeat protein